MADNKKYYYMRLKENFFDDDSLRLLEGMHDGYLYSNILLKMYLKSLKTDGRLMLNNVIPYSPDMIAVITGHNVGTVEKALEMFKTLGLIEILDNGAIYMLNLQNFIGQSSTEADRKRQYDRKIADEKQNCTNVGEISEKCLPEIELDIEIDIDKDKEKDIEIKSEKKGGRKPQKVYFPGDEKLNQAFIDFVEMRKKIKRPLTERAIDMQIRKLHTLAKIPFSDSLDADLAIQILNQSTMNCWLSLYALKEDKLNNNNESAWVDKWRDA